jgi:hypothetical protein
MEELFELIYFFIPLAFILFFRFLSNRSARNDQSNQTPNSTRSEPSGQTSGESTGFFSNLGQHIGDFLGFSSVSPIKPEEKIKQPVSGDLYKKRYQPQPRTAESIAQSMYKSDIGSGGSKEKPLIIGYSQTKVTRQNEKSALATLDRINKLPTLKRAIIWNEILNKPKGW